MQVHRSDDADSEQVSDALIDGDVVLVTGTARAALRHRDFRIYWSGVFASNIGRWMQNVLLGAYGFVLTHSALWIMGFGGSVGVGALVWGPFAHHSIGALLVIGAVWALVLAAFCAPSRLTSEVRPA
jgi:hypothetical protein